ncbi:RagB/SusD family nutrient uptake outer membrane protein [Proteiniphilum acetatigenes]|uniref:RagB/SusD family nutrient uptake outer membrane protein n=1 Tax=Proteiniphilum acetatigenes TaxID=294710 RepID=UPI001FDF4A3D|nr:RagB/SusD family nutrient uptake outer membrane protein [Proteiniphilum acetatigenes]
MKNSRYKFFGLPAIMIIMAFFSCNDDFLNQVPDDILTLEEVFNRRDLSEEWLANVYNYIRDEAHRTNSPPWDNISDDSDVSQRGNPFQVNLGNWNASSNYWNFWTDYYKGIRDATTFINNIDGNEQILESREGEALIRQRKGEARFLRAFFYTELLKQYGPVIIIGDEEINPDLPMDNPLMQLPRSPYDECVNYIASELDKAMEEIPVVHYIDDQVLRSDFGRASKILCMAVKSRLLLYAASPLFNGNSEYSGFANKDGTPLVNTTYDAGKWERAANAAKEVIDYAESTGNLGLYTRYRADGSIDGFLSYRDLFLDSWNIEWILARNTANMHGWQRSNTPRLANGYASHGPTQQLIDVYRMADGTAPVTGYRPDGTPIINPAAVGYSEEGFENYQAPGATRAVPTYRMYINREPRFYATVAYSGSDWINTTSSLGVREIQLYYTGESGKGGSHDYSETGYLWRKNVSPTYHPTQNNVARTYVMMRYAEILLNYVEALNEYDPGNSDILKYLNRIRERGGLAPLESGLDQDQMRDEIRKERRIELTIEHLRYFDTRRWKIAEETDGGLFWGMNVESGTSNTDPAFFQRTIFETRVFRKNFYLFPIPQSEVEKNQNLAQNPGW